MLRISPYRLREVAEKLGARSLNGQWDTDDVRKVAYKLVVIGTDTEKADAKAALVGPLRNPKPEQL